MELIESDKLVGGSEQTKNWRKKQPWYKTGKSNECEKYQIDLIKKITEKENFEKHTIVLIWKR